MYLHFPIVSGDSILSSHLWEPGAVFGGIIYVVRL